MNLPHGFTKQKTFDAYLSCLNNIKIGAALSFSRYDFPAYKNHPIHQGTVKTIVDPYFPIYRGPITTQKFEKLILFSPKDNDLAKYLFSDFNTSLHREIIRTNPGLDLSLKHFLYVDQRILITGIKNPTKSLI